VKDELKASAERVIRETIENVGAVAIQMTSHVRTPPRKADVLPGVKNTIAVASGKGGVGKSTVAVNLAVSLALDGAKVGLLDADIYGPSIPLMMGINQRPQLSQQKLMPLTAHGVSVMSIGFLVDPLQAVIWRGPMVSGAIKQFMSDVNWGELDYLVFDLLREPETSISRSFSRSPSQGRLS
jgi:ATP-binding protein involved in chromosome partitioning